MFELLLLLLLCFAVLSCEIVLCFAVLSCEIGSDVVMLCLWGSILLGGNSRVHAMLVPVVCDWLSNKNVRLCNKNCTEFSSSGR